MSEPRREKVFLLHGIALNRFSLLFLEKRLRKSGFEAEAISYPSTKHSLDDLAQWFYAKYLAPDVLQNFDRIHFVGHSMGGLVIRRALHNYRDQLPADKIGRVVMLGTPNGGSEIADFLQKFIPFRKLYGPAGAELTTHHQKSLQAPLYYEAGAIAGTSRWLYPLASIWIKGDHDGRVSVKSTKLPDLKDHMVINASHTFMIYRGRTARLVISFLKNGQFQS
ncbi:MAG: alpha/beta fold hydrolase [Alphaproteobacteria bacterium]|nr:alpha/beta fold hydrolase [Alphaproteobacteria bacterium]